MRKKIDYALWEVTQKCNLQCIHCRADASPNKKEGELIEGENIKKLINDLSELGCPALALTGGEPLLRKDLLEIIKYANSKNIKTRIQSNGLLLTEKLADELKKVGILSYGIGLDGANEEINDKIRNKKGALKKAIEAIKILKERDIKVHVEFTVTKINIGELKGTLDLLESLGVDTFLARAAVFAGRAEANNPLFKLSPEEYKKFLEEIYNEKRKRKIIMNCQDPLYHLVDKELVEKMKKHGNIYSGKIISGCTAGINMVHIHSNGDVGICTFLDIVLGNILKDSLVKIWNNRDKINQVNKLINRQYKGKCKDCSDRFICGGCRARAWYIKNDLLAHDPYCWKYLNG